MSATVISRGNPDPQGMRIVRSGTLTWTKAASTQVSWATVYHNLGYVPIVDSYMTFQLPSLPAYPGWIQIPYTQSTGSGTDVGKQNFRVNVVVNSSSMSFAAITDPLTTDTYWYTTAFDVTVSYYIWSRPMEIMQQ